MPRLGYWNAHSDRDFEDNYEPPEEDDGDDEYDESEECGRWRNGSLVDHCLSAGTEWCDWICPMRRTGTGANVE